MEILVFTLNAIVVYLVSDRIVRIFEQKRGEPLKQRHLAFFVVFLVLALISFNVLNRLFAGA